MGENVAQLSAAEWLRLKQIRGLLYIAIEDGSLADIKDHVDELDELLTAIERLRP